MTKNKVRRIVETLARELGHTLSETLAVIEDDADEEPTLGASLAAAMPKPKARGKKQ